MIISTYLKQLQSK